MQESQLWRRGKLESYCCKCQAWLPFTAFDGKKTCRLCRQNAWLTTMDPDSQIDVTSTGHVGTLLALFQDTQLPSILSQRSIPTFQVFSLE